VPQLVAEGRWLPHGRVPCTSVSSVEGKGSHYALWPLMKGRAVAMLPGTALRSMGSTVLPGALETPCRPCFAPAAPKREPHGARSGSSPVLQWFAFTLEAALKCPHGMFSWRTLHPAPVLSRKSGGQSRGQMPALGWTMLDPHRHQRAASIYGTHGPPWGAATLCLGELRHLCFLTYLPQTNWAPGLIPSPAKQSKNLHKAKQCSTSCQMAVTWFLAASGPWTAMGSPEGGWCQPCCGRGGRCPPPGGGGWDGLRC
jgi:hypothetical protein